MNGLRFPTLLLLVCALALPGFADGTASGSLTVNGKTVQLKYGYAVLKEDPFDKKKKATQLLVTDQAIPAEAAGDDFKLMEVRDKQKLNGVMVLITDDKRIVSGAVYSPLLKKMDYVSGVGMQKLELTAHTPSRVAGRVWLEKPDDFFDNLYQYNITFDVPVSVAKPDRPEQPKGTPLPAGGGDPGKAYDAYRKALLGGNIPALRRSVVAEHVKDMDNPDFKDQLKMIQAFQPKNVKVTGGAVDGDTATLLATARDGNESSNGTITMVREGGAWRLSKESWRSKAE
ncbi:MAG TPA: hypothetical protein VGR02_13525 [Thermoanaerobaculia bacterium]|jgi:hypothetical protein|nr:hypothetical protein [Thermoanaerobaculia bacterium]